MVLRYFALVYGIVFLLVGIAGFVPAFVTAPTPADPGLAVTAGHGRLFGLFPVNVLHNLVHVGFGVWGLLAYRTMSSSLFYARAVAVVYAVFVVMGLIPVLNTVFGLVPLHGHDVWLHALLAGVAAYFGFVYPTEETPVTTGTRTPGHGATGPGGTGANPTGTGPAGSPGPTEPQDPARPRDPAP